MTWAHARQVPGTAASKGVRMQGYRFRRGCVEGFPGTDPTPGLRADIFRPQGRMGALSERSQRRRVICEASPSGHATERTTSSPPARYRAGDGDAVNTDSQDAVGRAWSSDLSSVAVGNCGAS